MKKLVNEIPSCQNCQSKTDEKLVDKIAKYWWKYYCTKQQVDEIISRECNNEMNQHLTLTEDKHYSFFPRESQWQRKSFIVSVPEETVGSDGRRKNGGEERRDAGNRFHSDEIWRYAISRIQDGDAERRQKFPVSGRHRFPD